MLTTHRVTALAVTAAVFVTVLVKVALILGISPVVCMVAFGVYFATGGGLSGLIKSLASLLAGAFWQLIANMLVVANESTLGDYRWLLFGAVVLIVILQSRIAVLSSVPGGLCGAAMAVSAPAPRPYGILVATALIAGSLAGFGAELAAGRVAKQV